MSVMYAEGDHEVLLGDSVSIDLWFRRRKGRVVYVPGVSAVNTEFEYNGTRWVGIRLANNNLVATPVLSKTGALKKKIRFIRRDSSPCDLIAPNSKEFEDRGEGPAF